MWWKSSTAKLLLVVSLVFLAAVFAWRAFQEDTLVINDARISVEIVRTQQEMQQGLSGRKNLAKDEGMLFWYQEPSYPSFWMKDMVFPIDIIWIGQNWRVAGIQENISPDSYPQTFLPGVPVQYVLEVNAFFAKDHNISVGDKAELQ